MPTWDHCFIILPYINVSNQPEYTFFFHVCMCKLPTYHTALCKSDPLLKCPQKHKKRFSHTNILNCKTTVPLQLVILYCRYLYRALHTLGCVTEKADLPCLPSLCDTFSSVPAPWIRSGLLNPPSRCFGSALHPETLYSLGLWRKSLPYCKCQKRAGRHYMRIQSVNALC